MKDIRLTESQQKDLIRELIMATSGDLPDELIQLLDYKPAYELARRYHVQIHYRLTQDSRDANYTLTIGYHDQPSGRNPETIMLHQETLTNGWSYDLLSLARLGYVTDRLREYNIW